MDVIEVSESEHQSDVEMEEVKKKVDATNEQKETNDEMIFEENGTAEVTGEKGQRNVVSESRTSENSEAQNDTELVDTSENPALNATSNDNTQNDEISNSKHCSLVEEIIDVEVKEIVASGTKFKEIIKFRNQKKQVCCNWECESGSNIPLMNAVSFVLSYYGLQLKKNKSQKVCKNCFDKAYKHHEHLMLLLTQHKSLFSAEFPVRKDIEVIDDSDDEASEEEPILGDDFIKGIDEYLSEVITLSIDKYDLDYQIREADLMLNESVKHLQAEFSKTDEVLDDLQKEVDEIRRSVYVGFTPKIREQPAIDILDTQGSSISDRKLKIFSSTSTPNSSPGKRSYSISSPQESPRRSSLVGVATKKVTQVQRTVFPGLPQIEVLQQEQQQQLEVVALEQVKQVRPTLPPLGQLHRPKPAVNDVVYVMRHGYYGVWARAKVLEVLPKEIALPGKPEYLYKVRFESRKSSMVKTVTGKQLAYPHPSPVRLPVGTRVIALFRDEWAKECYYAGIIAEPPKAVNTFRYLVFFDDGYAQYVSHEKVLLVCESSRNVWEDIHPESRDFVRGYLEQYPERPMLKLQQGQIVRTEWNGKWWIARVVEVDGSLVKMHFDADGRTELIYRGSTRLGPLYSELHNADARKKWGSFGRHRSMGISSLKKRNMPYVEYTRTELEDNKHEESGGGYDEFRTTERTLPSRAVAKKSTSKRSDNSIREHLEALIAASDNDLKSGHVKNIQMSPVVKPCRFGPHQCGNLCIDGIKHDSSQVKQCSPLVLPLLYGWQRHVTRCKAKKIVLYRSPCGRRLRNMEELHRYLRVSKSDLSVDLFDFDSWVHSFAEFVTSPGFINIKDLSYGCEKYVPVPCVNHRDHSEPEYVKYSTKRLPMEGVKVNTSDEFLVSCDCTDDCQDKEKCACWQLTIQGTAYGPGGKVDSSVGYCFKRLREPVMTGIYECNKRCKCAVKTCLNRVAQHPLQLRLQVFKTENRGWGIRCLNDIPHGSFICIYAGRLLTEQGANECVFVKGGKNYGDEYLAELDYIEVVERLKEGYESDVVEDDDAFFENPKDTKSRKERSPTDSGSEEEEEDGETSQDAHDSDFEVEMKHQHLNVLPLEESTIRTRLRNRKARNSSTDSQGKDSIKTESTFIEKDIKKLEIEKKDRDDTSSLITLSDDEDDEKREREPSRFAAVSGPKKEMEKKPAYKSVREFYGDDEYCYIMDAKNDGNIGRYLNHSCTPNVFVQNVFVDTHDLRFPWVAFFALTYISAGTELTWDYNYDVGSVPGKVLHCYCGSNECRGRLL